MPEPSGLLLRWSERLDETAAKTASHPPAEASAAVDSAEAGTLPAGAWLLRQARFRADGNLSAALAPLGRLPGEDNLLNPRTTLWQRQREVVVGGLADGLAGAATHTWSDLRTGASSFLNNPLAATRDFARNHWHEAAIAAAITLINPRRWVNVLLVGFAMRGPAVSTFQAARAAWDPQADLASLRKNFAGSISHEGAAFLTSLPVVMAGGMAGRAGANAVFGKNMGALDLATGRVTMAEVRNNLWRIHDSVRPPSTRLVITDMDNTLGNFNRYFALGVERAIPEMAANRRLIEANRALPSSQRIPEVNGRLSEEALYKMIGNAMERHRSHDYPWALEISVGQRLQVGEPGRMTWGEFSRDVSKPFWRNIDESLVKHFEVYPEVVSTLARLREMNIPVVVLSDAPAYVGLRRLTHLGLDKEYTQRLYALRNWTEPAAAPKEMLAHGRQRVDDMLNLPHALHEFRMIPKNWEKPHPEGFQLLMQQYGVRPRQVLMVGDSRVKDVGVAVNAGARGIWARYGQAEPRHEQILMRLRPLPAEVPAAQSGPKVYPRMEGAIDSYAGLLNHLTPRADSRALAAATARSLLVVPPWQSGLAYSFDQPFLPGDLSR